MTHVKYISDVYPDDIPVDAKVEFGDTVRVVPLGEAGRKRLLAEHPRLRSQICKGTSPVTEKYTCTLQPLQLQPHE